MTDKKAAADATDVAQDEAKQDELAQAEAVQGEVTSESGSVETDGIRARRALMLKQFLPDPDWINKNIVAGGKGTRGTIGRIYGLATGYERRNNTLPDGSISESIFVRGIFQSEGYVTGEASEASGVFFPMAYAEKIAAVLDMGVKTVEIDCDVGLEATGKTIPYEWVVIAYREGVEMDVLRRIRGVRPRPSALLVDGTGKPKELAASAQKALPST